MRTLFAGSTALMGAGAVIAAPLIYAIDKAAELQKQMIAIQIATRGSTDQMNQMRRSIEQVAGVTIFSNIDVAKMAKIVATGTGLGAQQVTSLLPVFGRFADVQSLMKGTPYEESITNLVRLAHTAQHYDAPGLARYADLLTKASLIVPGGLGEVGHALKYSQGIAKTALGTDDESMVLLTALLNRLGLSGSRGGTNLIAAMSRTIPGVFGSGLLKGKSNEALLAMGMVDAQGHSKVFSGGKFDPIAWMGYMSGYVQREFASHPEAIARQDIMKNFQHAYGVQGSRVASLLGSPQAIDQWRMIGETFAQYGGVEAIQKRFADASVAQQYTNAVTNFQSAMAELGITLLPTATRFLKTFNGYMQNLIEWITKNPGKVKEYATNIAYFAAALIGLGIIGNVTGALIGLTTVLKGLWIVAAAAQGKLAAGGALATATKWTGGAIAAGAIGYEVATALGAGKLGEYLAAKIYERIHPYDPNAKPVVGGGKTPVTVHTQINLDGKKVANAVTKHQATAAAAPQTGPNIFDGRQALSPAGTTGSW